MIGFSPSTAARLSGYCFTLGGTFPVNITGSIFSRPQSVFPLAQTGWSLRSSLCKLLKFHDILPSLNSRLVSMSRRTSIPSKASPRSSPSHRVVTTLLGPMERLMGSVSESLMPCPAAPLAVMCVPDIGGRGIIFLVGTVVYSAPVSIKNSISNS